MKRLGLNGSNSVPGRGRYFAHTFSLECTFWQDIGMCLGSNFPHPRALSDRVKEQSKPFECMPVRQSSRHYRSSLFPTWRKCSKSS